MNKTEKGEEEETHRKLNPRETRVLDDDKLIDCDIYGDTNSSFQLHTCFFGFLVFRHLDQFLDQSIIKAWVFRNFNNVSETSYIEVYSG